MLGRDRCLVLRTYDLGETSRIVSLLGDVHGRLRLVARGARAPRSRLGACLEVGNEIEIVFSQNTGRELGTLREASLRQAWVAGSARLEAVGAGLATLELLDRLVPEGAADAGVLAEARLALARVRAAPDRPGALVAFYGFEMRLLERFGLRPDWEACARCGSPPAGGVAYVDVRAGSLLCQTCGHRAAGRFAVSAEELRVLRALAADLSTDADAVPATATRRRVGLLLHRLLGAHLDRYRYPRSLALLKKVDTRSAAAIRTDARADTPGAA